MHSKYYKDMGLLSVVSAIVCEHDVSDKEIAETVLFLMQDNILRSPKVFKRVVDELKQDLDAEESPFT